MPPRRKPIYADVASPLQERKLEQHIEALVTTQRRQTLDIPVERIRPNPFQARKSFEGVEELAATIRVQGFTTRLLVRPDPSEPGTFQLVFGERRLQAARLAGLAVVPCDVREHSDAELIEIGLAENIQRRDLHPLEEAQAFQSMIEQRGYSERDLAERIGKDRGYIQNRLALLRAPADVQELVAQRPDTLSAARAIAQVPTAQARRPLLDGVASGALTHKDVLALVRSEAPDPTTALPEPASHPRSSSMPLARALDRDVPMLYATIARWRLALPRSRPEDREQLETAVRECIKELEAFVELLAHRGA